jgi:predicted metal-dependent HD superfamily phosphohydrolase
MPALIAWFRQDVTALVPGVDDDVVQSVGADLLDRWTEPHRRYHGTRHLVELFWALEELEEAGEIGSRDGALGRLASWWHDAVYSVSDPVGNEAASAELATRQLAELGFDPADRADVEAMVRASERHELTDGTGILAAFTDADLWILAAPEERFDAYCAQVREEYAQVADEDYRRGRTAILRPFLDRPEIYATGHARREWTPAARANLERELSRLG